jgi:dipeptidyl aminopeptidase/acylaminoacyl peptidase
LIASGTIGLSQITLDGEDIYWVELRPAEGGRGVIVRRTPEGKIQDVTPHPFNARTRVHEYGGGAFAVTGGVVCFSNFEDQRLYRQELNTEPRPITPEWALRYADGVIDRQRGRMICVREDHTVEGREPVNALVAVNLEGDPQGGEVLISGSDFYSSPGLSPDERFLAWLSWDHPNMPWDGTELWVAELADDGSIARKERIAGGSHESIFQPEWSPDGRFLLFVSDRSGWWNLYRWDLQSGGVEPLVEMEAEFGRPQWLFGMHTYAFESQDRIVCSYTQRGKWQLASLDLGTGKLEPLETPYTEISYVRAAPGHAVFVGGAPTEPLSVISLDLETKELEVLRRSSEVEIDPGYISIPEAIEFPTSEGRKAYAFFYRPKNRDYEVPEGERPPLIVRSHGGPTAAASSALNLGIQYWTSRGIAVIDVNYRGSTGYGRAYREEFEGRWGIVDVEDCINAARFLVERGEVDGERLAISGGSAGGYTTLCALVFHKLFKAGASYFGVSDLEALAKQTHKFESRYLERLIGPYPERRDLYRERSPIHFVEWLECPVIFFQGLEDKIVPPDQAKLMVEALKRKGLPVAYVPFPDEQHGFRRAENIKRAIEAELYFYAKVFGFEPADAIEPVPIENRTT